MKESLMNLAKKSAEKIYKYFGEDSGKMLLATSIIGISTSCFAQTAAIILNKKYTISQKAFMIPQELVEGMITVFSIFMITKPIQRFARKYNSTGKLVTKELAEYMKNNDLMEKRGAKNFSLPKSINEIINTIEKSDKFIKSNETERVLLISEHKKALNDYEAISDSTSAIATTVGSVLSTAIIAPILRNHAASGYQNININMLNKMETNKKSSPVFKSRPVSYSYGRIGRV